MELICLSSLLCISLSTRYAQGRRIWGQSLSAVTELCIRHRPGECQGPLLEEHVCPVEFENIARARANWGQTSSVPSLPRRTRLGLLACHHLKTSQSSPTALPSATPARYCYSRPRSRSTCGQACSPHSPARESSP